MADMDDSYTPILIPIPTSSTSNTMTTTTTTSSDSTSIPTSFTSSTTSSFSFGAPSTSHAQRPHLNSATSTSTTSTSSTSAFPDFNFSSISTSTSTSTSTSASTSTSISLPSFTSPQPQAHKRTSEAVNGDAIDDDEDDDERGHASKRKYQREEQDDEDQDREEEEKGTMNDSSGGPDDSFMDLLNIFSKLNFPEGQPEPCPLCPLTFPIKEFAAHVYKCIKQLDEVDREQQERADAQLAYKIATEVGAEEDQFFYTRKTASTDEDMSTTSQRRKCKDGIRCKRVDARHFIDIEHPPVSCPICEQQYPVYELDAHITICLTQPQQPKPAFSQSSGTSFSAIAGDTNMDGNTNTNSNSAFSSAAFTSIRDDIAQPSPSPPLPAKIVFGEDFNDDDDRDDSKDTPIRRSASAGANIGRHQLTLEQAAAMASLVVDQQSKSAANQDYSLVDLLDTFKTLGFTQENLTNLSKTIDTNKQTTSSATSPPPTTSSSSSQPTSSNTT